MSLRVLFYPQAPRPQAVLPKICARLGHDVATNPDVPCDIAIFWTTSTVRRRDARLAAIARGVPVLNHRCHDIGKRHVDRVFRSVFGYGSLLDPRTHRGVCVRKSNLNAQHDGVVRRCPFRSVERRFVYQHVIDNVVDGSFAEDLRTPVAGGDIPLVYRVRRPLASRFGRAVSARPIDPAQVYSAVEMDGIRRFCRAMGLDYGELDVLRDRRDGRLFIVDANPTPWPPDAISDVDFDRSVQRMAASFRRLVHGASTKFSGRRQSRMSGS